MSTLLILFFVVINEPTWVAHYRIEYPPSVFSEQYIMIQDGEITQIGYQANNPDIVNCYVFSKKNNKVSAKVINHGLRVAFKHEMDYESYMESFPRYSVNYVDGDSSILNLTSSHDSLQYLVHLSGSYPNLHPITFMIPEVTSLPAKIKKGDKIFSLIRITEDRQIIDSVMQKINCSNCYALSLEDVQFELLEESGITFDQMKEILLSTPRH